MTAGRSHRCRRARALMALLGVSLLGAGACGIPLDDAPRALTATTVTSTTEPPATTEPADEVADGTSSAFLYFVANNLLINLDVESPSREPRDVLTTLFAGLPAGANADVASQIPLGTRLLDVVRDGDELDVDVSKEFYNLVGPARVLATAQIVMTATDLPGIDQVTFRIGGEPTQVFSQVSGDADAVGPCDYLGLLPTDDVIEEWSLDRVSRSHLTTRRNRLTDVCEPADN